jgi:ribbon-helix-helix CopG family protein
MRYAHIMKRTTVMFSDETDRRLRLEARRRGVPIAELVREAVDRQFPQTDSGTALSFFGIIDDGPEDASERVDEYVRAALRRRAKRRR